MTIHCICQGFPVPEVDAWWRGERSGVVPDSIAGGESRNPCAAPVWQEAALGECLEIRQEALAEGHWLIFNTMSVLGESLAGQGADSSLALEARIEKLREAEALLLEGYEGMKDHPDGTDERKREALERIVNLYEAWHEAEPGQGYDAEAAEWRAKLPPESTSQPAE